jgi:ElaB/YqjD/DUF883 family membrane-anchored ribosome-binding protein
MEQNRSKILWGLAIGAAAGFVIGYLLSGKKLGDMEQDLTDAADRAKERVKDTIGKGKDFVNSVKEKMSEPGNAQT